MPPSDPCTKPLSDRRGAGKRRRFSPGAGLGRSMAGCLMVLMVALVAAACGESGEPSTGGETSVTTAAAPTAPPSTDPAAEPVITTTAQETTTTTPVPTTEAEPTTTVTVEQTTTTTAVEETTTTTGAAAEDDFPLIEGLDPVVSALIWKTAEVAEGIRGLDFDGLPTITVLSPEDFSARVRMEIESEQENIEVDEALLKLLGLLEPDDDLVSLYSDLYGESVAGFYSSEDKEMVLPRSGEEFSAVETLTLLHELVHALTDQHFDFGSKLDELADSQLYDQASGMVSLLEGDAILSEVVYVQNLDPSERDRLMREYADFEPPDIDIPLFMELALHFPYDAGFEYVLNSWRAGGWRAVDALYLDPPRSTEEIYEGARTASTEVMEMRRPAGALPEGYEEIYDYTWGFLDILIMFEQVLGPEAAVQAATGWGGGRSLVGYSEAGEVVLVWEYAGDSPGESEELALLLHDYAVAGMDVGTPSGPPQESGFAASGEDYVFVGLTPEGLVMVACSDPGVCPSVTASYSS